MPPQGSETPADQAIMNTADATDNFVSHVQTPETPPSPEIYTDIFNLFEETFENLKIEDYPLDEQIRVSLVLQTCIHRVLTAEQEFLLDEFQDAVKQLSFNVNHYLNNRLSLLTLPLTVPETILETFFEYDFLRLTPSAFEGLFRYIVPEERRATYSTIIYERISDDHRIPYFPYDEFYEVIRPYLPEV
jgi:hypothetical protein